MCGIGNEVKEYSDEGKLLNKRHPKQTLVPLDYDGLSGTQHPNENVPLKRTEYSNEHQDPMQSQTGVIQVWSYG